jgi:AcrR family transcriptional regulator
VPDERVEPRLTPKGAATRGRILRAAEDLFYERGVARTGNTDLREAAAVSGSQLNHYFPDRQHLVRAVLADRVAAAADDPRLPGAGAPTTLAALEAWADAYVTDAADRANGCRVGSLVAETLRTGLSESRDGAAAFAEWLAAIERAVTAVQDAGDLDESADPARLAAALLGALQGGLLLLQATGDPAALRASLDGALALVRSHATRT